MVYILILRRRWWIWCGWNCASKVNTQIAHQQLNQFCHWSCKSCHPRRLFCLFIMQIWINFSYAAHVILQQEQQQQRSVCLRVCCSCNCCCLRFWASKLLSSANRRQISLKMHTYIHTLLCGEGPLFSFPCPLTTANVSLSSPAMSSLEISQQQGHFGIFCFINSPLW